MPHRSLLEGRRHNSAFTLRGVSSSKSNVSLGQKQRADQTPLFRTNIIKDLYNKLQPATVRV